MSCRDTLRRLRRDEVLVRQWPHDGIPTEYFYLADRSLPLAFAACGHCFEQDELDLASHSPTSELVDAAASTRRAICFAI